jgi:hypothetical protein
VYVRSPSANCVLASPATNIGTHGISCSDNLPLSIIVRNVDAVRCHRDVVHLALTDRIVFVITKMGTIMMEKCAITNTISHTLTNALPQRLSNIHGNILLPLTSVAHTTLNKIMSINSPP